MTFLLLVLGHFLADFWLQSDRTAINKELSKRDNKEARDYALNFHIFTHVTVTTFILLIYTVFFAPVSSGKDLLFKTVLIILIIITNGLFHYFLDSNLRPRLRENQFKFKKIIPYLIDQMLHLSTIYLLLFLSNIITRLLSKSLYFLN